MLRPKNIDSKHLIKKQIYQWILTFQFDCSEECGFLQTDVLIIMITMYYIMYMA